MPITIIIKYHCSSKKSWKRNKIKKFVSHITLKIKDHNPLNKSFRFPHSKKCPSIIAMIVMV
jgi:hypothetical protein